MLGVSPTLVRALIPKGEPAADLSSLRAVTTTGEPWNRGPYDWLSEHVCGGGRIPIVNISGGTEVGACFLAVSMLAPTKPCSLGFPALGQDMDVVDDSGRPLRGAVGELVCRRPWPGMTRGIWGDPERYLETYWRRFPGVWTHGDWASVDEDGYWFLHGRSDDTLNIAGKRIGPAELESAAVNHPAVTEAAAIGVPHEVKGEVAWLFCVLRPGEEAKRGRGRPSGDGRAREGLQAGARPLRLGASEDAEREDRAPGGAGERAPGRSRRPLHPGESRRARGDRACRLTSFRESRSSPAAAAGSAPRSRASWRRRECGSRSRRARASRWRQVAGEIDGLALVGDVSRQKDVEAWVERTEKELGPIELLAANAGIGSPEGADLGRPARGLVARTRGQRSRRSPLMPRGDSRACSSVEAGASS